MSLVQQIEKALRELPFVVEPSVPLALERYLTLLIHWNKTYNLSGIRDPTKMISHHLLDSLSIVPYINGSHIVDVGSGAGFPGIPLASYFLNKHFTLVDGNGKKTRFLTQVKIELELENIAVAHSRAESFDGKFNHVVCRALAPLDNLAKSCAHLIGTGGTLIAMKAGGCETLPEDSDLEIISRVPLRVPLIDEERVLVIMQQKNSGFFSH